MKRLTLKQHIYIGSMLFGMLFGAGNLIFPVYIGQQSGNNFNVVILGFLISAVGFPLFTFIALGVSQTFDIFTLSKRVNKLFALIYPILLYLSIGPLFSLPRLAATSFTIGISPIIQSSSTLSMVIYSIIFFVAAFILSINPSKLLHHIGKILTPLFLICLGIVLLLSVIHPMGSPSQYLSQTAYSSSPLAKGILDGYQTLDMLASFAFGVIVLETLQQLGVTKPQHIAKDMIKSSIICIIIMSLIYWLLAYAGASSLGKLSLSQNGGIALSQIIHYYLGDYGYYLMASIVVIGCLKTAVGLLSAVSEAITRLFPRFAYKTILIIVSISATIIASFGLSNIIIWAVPVLVFLYPISICLTLLALCEKWFNRDSTVYQLTIGFSIIPALLDALSNLPSTSGLLFNLKQYALTVNQFLPFASYGFGWFVPAIIGFFLGFIYLKMKKPNQ